MKFEVGSSKEIQKGGLETGQGKAPGQNRESRRDAPESGQCPVRRAAFDRMKVIHNRIAAGGYPNCVQMARELEVSVKTVKRDVAFLRDRLGEPLSYDQKRHGFYLNGPVRSYFDMDASERELFALLVAGQAIEQYRGTPFRRLLEPACSQLSRQWNGLNSPRPEGLVSFRAFAPEDADPAVFEEITLALRERRALRFNYRKPGRRTPESRQTHPYHLFAFHGRWYLRAHDTRRGELRTFALGRMRGLEVLEERFVRPAAFDPRTEYQNSIGVMTGTGNYDVRIELDAWMADVVRGRRLHPSQEWVDLAGGGALLRVCVDSLNEIEELVFGWGEHASILGPDELRSRFAQKIDRMHRKLFRSGSTQK